MARQAEGGRQRRQLLINAAPWALDDNGQRQRLTQGKQMYLIAPPELTTARPRLDSCDYSADYNTLLSLPSLQTEP